MHLDGWTLLLQAANFLVLVWLAKRFLYAPVLAAIDRRQAEIARVRGEAEAARTEAAAAREAIAAERAGMAAERERIVAAATERARSEGEALLAAAAAEAERTRAGARLALAEERREALAGLKREAGRLATGIAGHLLATTVDGAVTRIFVERAAADLARRPAHEREALAAQLDPADAVRVVTAVPLDDDARRHCTECLAGALGRPVATEFADDAGLIAGVELHFPHTVLRRSWRDALAEAEEAVTQDAADAGDGRADAG